MSELPKNFQSFVKKYPKIWDAHQIMTEACAEIGPLDRKARELIKLGICIAAGLETATKRHAIMAKEEGASTEEIYQVVLMNLTTCGFPTTAAGFKWVTEAIGEE